MIFCVALRCRYATSCAKGGGGKRQKENGGREEVLSKEDTTTPLHRHHLVRSKTGRAFCETPSCFFTLWLGGVCFVFRLFVPLRCAKIQNRKCCFSFISSFRPVCSAILASTRRKTTARFELFRMVCRTHHHPCSQYTHRTSVTQHSRKKINQVWSNTEISRKESLHHRHSLSHALRHYCVCG